MVLSALLAGMRVTCFGARIQQCQGPPCSVCGVVMVKDASGHAEGVASQLGAAFGGAHAEAMDDRFLIHARVLASVVSYGHARGCTPDQIRGELAALHLDDVRYDTYDGYISLNRFARLLQRFGTLLDDETVGIAVANHTDAGSLGVLGKAYVSAPDVTTALNVLTHYMRLYADLSFASLSIGDERAEYSWAYSPVLVSRDFVSDRSAQFFISTLQRIFGQDIRPLEVKLQRTRPKDPAPFRAAFGNNVVFDAPENMVALRRVDLDRTNPHADASAFELAVALADRMMLERRVPDDLSTRAREDVIMNLRDEGPDMNETARRLGMSPRSLQRRLEELGTSFQKLSDDARRALARELLSQTTLPINEIAFRLGFANQANLTRAAKRWFGLSPKAVRKSSAQ